MTVNIEILSSRLRQAREVLGYSIELVSAETAISVTRLTAVEEGSTTPSGDEVLILAAFYDCDYRAFLEESRPAPVEQSDILFRRYGESFSPEDRRAVQEFLRLCELEGELEKALSEKKHRFQFTAAGTFYKAHGEQAAAALRSQLGYEPNVVPRDVYADFRSVGIHIFRRALANQEISGLYIEHPVAGHCVLVNYDEDVYRQRFSVSHEVAHAIFDSSEGVVVTFESRSSKYSASDLKEIRANTFASHYLMPRSMLSKLPKLDEVSAKHWAQEFRVSTSALAHALKDSGLVDEAVAAAIRRARVPKQEKIDPEASDSLTPAQRDRRLVLLKRGLSDYYVGLCFEAHHRELITTARLAECLRVSVADLAELAKLYGRNLSHGV
jgi:Zn-dependent peptidase ImmA (M78 family)/transcriptional regulator with XRE-family HTH domain